MSKKSAIEKNLRREKLANRYAVSRDKLKKIVYGADSTPEDRFRASVKLASMPRNGSKTRIRNRCGLTGRPRGYYRKFGLSRIALRELSSLGYLPGVTKSSW